MIISDYILVIISTYLALIAYKEIVYSQSTNLYNYAILIIYILNCTPVFMDIVFGIPTYPVWYSGFTMSQGNPVVRLIYNVYIIFVLGGLFLFNSRMRNKSTYQILGSKKFVLNKFWLYLGTLLPFIHIVLSPYISNYLVYGQITNRNIPVKFNNINASLILVSIVCFSELFFKGKRKSLVLFLLFNFLIIWINGKRNILIILLFLYMFYYNSYINKKNNYLKYIVPLAGIAIVLFSVFYLIQTRKSIDANFEDMYLNYRIDFGRDDVTKFVIYRELIEKNPIHDYRLQGLISILFIWIPRSIWLNKPYLHYRYLTAELVNLTPTTIHFGMTPSILEQFISDFGWIGIFLTPIILIILLNYSNNRLTVLEKVILLLLIINLLSMGFDYMLIYFIFIVIYRLLVNLTKISRGNLTL